MPADSAMPESDRQAFALSRLSWRYFHERMDALMPQAALRALEPHAQDIATLTDSEHADITAAKAAAVKAIFWIAAVPGATAAQATAAMLRDPDAGAAADVIAAAAAVTAFQLRAHCGLDGWECRQRGPDGSVNVLSAYADRARLDAALRTLRLRLAPPDRARLDTLAAALAAEGPRRDPEAAETALAEIGSFCAALD